MADIDTTRDGSSSGAEEEPTGVAFLRRQWDRVGAWACVVVGAVALLLGWLGVSDTPFAAEQVPFVISGGIGGVFFLGVGAMLWISADLHDEWRKLDEIEAVLLRRLPADAPSRATIADDRADAEPSPDDQVTETAVVGTGETQRNGARKATRARRG